MQELIDAQSKYVDHLGVEPFDGTPGGGGDDVIQRSAPPLHSGCDFGCQRAIAIVVEVFTKGSDRGRQAGAFRRHGAQDFVCRDPRRTDHALVRNRSPSATGCPARNSRDVIGRLPSSCNSRIASAPAPVATNNRSPAASTTTPGSAGLAAAATVDRLKMIRRWLRNA